MYCAAVRTPLQVLLADGIELPGVILTVGSVEFGGS
jgi:hypothetical protein